MRTLALIALLVLGFAGLVFGIDMLTSGGGIGCTGLLGAAVAAQFIVGGLALFAIAWRYQRAPQV